MKKPKKPYKEDTILAHAGLAPNEHFGVVTPPVTRASSIIQPSFDAYESGGGKFRYARTGTPLSDKFERAIAALENGHAAVATPSGMTAIVMSLLAFLKPGDHVLVTDAMYESGRFFTEDYLPRIGVEVEYYDPRIGKNIEKLIRKNTAVIYMESPGSGTFEVQDVPAISAIAKKHDIITMVDNSWASGLVFKPLNHGANISILSATKYIGGHADLMLGVIVTDSEEIYKKIKATTTSFGVCAGSEELYLALRGLRTIKLRMKQCAANALKVATWLEKRPEVQRVYYPVLPSSPDHKLWKRDFTGANGLFSILLKPAPIKSVATVADALKLFPIARSWGGYESLAQPQHMKRLRSAVPWKEKGELLRLHVGLEDPDDLIADLEQAFKKFKAS